jgi:hypothetical protein
VAIDSLLAAVGDKGFLGRFRERDVASERPSLETIMVFFEQMSD